MSHHGIGLRSAHFQQILADGPRVGLVEVITENLLGRGGRPRAVVERVRCEAALTFHGVSLSIGGLDPLSRDALTQLRGLIDDFEPCWVSDHLSFGAVHGFSGHDLWPVPFTEASLDNVVSRVAVVQERLGRRLVLENVSSYVEFAGNTMSEWDFTIEVLRRADCELLLDLNNLYINAENHGYDAAAALERLPTDRIRQLHLAGHADCGTHLFDTHGARVSDDVWQLFVQCVRHHGPKPSIIEWDTEVPALDVVLDEARRAEALEAAALPGLREVGT